MAKPIRILLTIADLTSGGAERQFSLLLKHLSRERFEPHVCFWRPVFRYGYPQDIPVHMITKDRPWHIARAIQDLRRLIETLQPQLIYSQLHYVNIVTGTALALARTDSGWICRQSSDPRREMRGPFAVWARWALRRADRVIGCSQGVVKATIEHLGLNPDRVQQLDNLADIQEVDRLSYEALPIAKSAAVFTIVHIGRLHKAKNQELLLNAFCQFRGRPAELWMLGEGEQQKQLKRLAWQLGIEQQVRWFGFQKNPFPFLRAADCLALSSDYEGLPNVVIEAMICGTPTVSTRCQFGPEELIEHGETGLLVPVGDTHALRTALTSLAVDPARRQRMGAMARHRAVKRFSIDSVSTVYEPLFEEVVREKNTRQSL